MCAGAALAFCGVRAAAQEPAPPAPAKSLEDQVRELRERQDELEQQLRALKAPPPVTPAEAPPG
jgi:uncharacterized membrane protein YgcG